MMVGCSRENEDRKISIQGETIIYEVENLSAFAIDSAGNVYSASTVFHDELSEIVINKYDEHGENQSSYILKGVSSSILTLTVNGADIYYVNTCKEAGGMALYSYNMNTDVISLLVRLPFSNEVKQLLYCENRVFILAEQVNQLIYYSLEEQELYQIDIENPMTIATNGNETIMIQADLGEDQYGMIQYHPKRDELEQKAMYHQNKINHFATHNNGDYIIYTYDMNSRGLVMSPMDSLDAEAEIYKDVFGLDSDIYCWNNNVYFLNEKRNIVCIPLNVATGMNESIQYISIGYEAEEPYGCGYNMIRQDLNEEQFTLKILAQDTDYDLCLMNSNYGSAYNVRENGNFYPLNNVPGVKEYFDACFPYIREAALNSEGDIWMLPISMDLAGFLVNEKYMEQYDVAMTDGMSFQAFFAMMEKMDEAVKEKVSCNLYTLKNAFFLQYFHKNYILEGTFQSQLELFQENAFFLPGHLQLSFDLQKDEFLFEYVRQENNYDMILNEAKENENLQFYSMPKLEASDPSIGTCLFMAVNPRSVHLDETLSYLSSWIEYVMKSNDKPIFMLEENSEAGKLEQSLYQLLEHTEISFAIDEDLYQQGLDEVIQGQEQIETYIEDTNRKLGIYFNE